MKYSRPYHDAVEMQQILMRDARNDETKPAVRGSLARSYVELEEMKRKLKMRPLPKSIDVSKFQGPKRKPKAGPGFSETPDDPTP